MDHLLPFRPHRDTSPLLVTQSSAEEHGPSLLRCIKGAQIPQLSSMIKSTAAVIQAAVAGRGIAPARKALELESGYFVHLV
jgi:hypothetical protein